MDRRFGLLRSGQAVLDLGCAPGSWLLYSAERIGEKGLVVGVDIHRLKIKLPDNARYLKGDVTDISSDDLRNICPRPFDVVLSDMAPHTTGARFVDQQRSLQLLLRALDLAETFAVSGATFVGKVFHSEDLEIARSRGLDLFHKAKLVKPKAVRKGSYELYLVAQRMRSSSTAELNKSQ